MVPPGNLFRKEVYAQFSMAQDQPLVAIPAAWRWVSLLLISFLAIAGIFLLRAQYVRFETVPGVVVADQPLLGAYSPQVITSTAGSIPPEEPATAQLPESAPDLHLLHSQILAQRALIAAARNDLERMRPKAGMKLVGSHELEHPRQMLDMHLQGMHSLTQALTDKEAAVRAQRQSGAGSLPAAPLDVAQAQAGRGGSSQGLPAAVPRNAPAAGMGQSPRPGLVLDVPAQIPASESLSAELAVPPAAIAFVQPGQVLQLAVDAFPPQRFGMVRGQVQAVAGRALTRPGPQGSREVVYLVTVRIDAPYVDAYGRKAWLTEGMTLSTRIPTQRMSLLEWVFEPVYAARRRLAS